MKLHWIATPAVGALLVVGAGRSLPAAPGSSRTVARNHDATLTEKQKVSYALGMNMATQIRALLIDVDADVVARAFVDAMARRNTLLTADEARSVMLSVQKELKTKRTAIAREKLQVRQALQKAAAPARMEVAFRVDPRLTTGVYGGTERWVKVPTYTRMGTATTCALEARIEVPGTTGPAPTATWTPSDPDMVTAEPREGAQTTLLVRRAGETHVRVQSQAGSRDLTIKASYVANVLKAEITQQ